MVQMLLLPFIPIMALIIQNSVLLVDVVKSLREAEDINGQASAKKTLAKS